MNIDRIFVSGCVGGTMGIVAACINHFPAMFKTKSEFTKLINEAMKLELPPSFKSIFVKNLTGIPTSLAVITVTSLLILGIRIGARDYFKKQERVDILHGIGAIATGIFTFYCTQSVGLSLVNLGVSLLPFYAKNFKPLIIPGVAAVVSGSFAFLSRTLYSAYEFSSHRLSYGKKYDLLIKENFNEYLDYNDGAARKVAEFSNNLGRGFFVDGAKKFGFSIIATSVGVTIGQIAAKGIVEASGVKPDKRQNQIASICGMVAGGALSFYFTRSVGLSSVNASICCLAPICFPRTY